MSKKTFYFVSTIVGAVAAVGIGCVTYFEPSNATEINSIISIASTAIIECCGKLIKVEEPSKDAKD